VTALVFHVVVLGLMALPALDRLSALDEPAAVTVTLEPFLVPAEREPRAQAAPRSAPAYAPRMAARPPTPSPVAPIRRSARPRGGQCPRSGPERIPRPCPSARPATFGPPCGPAESAAPTPRPSAWTAASAIGCHERWGQAARTAPVYANVPASARAGLEFARQAVQQEIDRADRDAPIGTGLHPGDSPPAMREIPFVLGAQQDGLGRPMDALHQRRKQLDDALKPPRR
jgi:hypothetical protein